MERRNDRRRGKEGMMGGGKEGRKERTNGGMGRSEGVMGGGKE